jgi:hypothetical protein
MDVLKEIKEAEKQAEGIELEYRSKADALLSSVSLELQKETTLREEKLTKAVEAFRADNAKAKEKAREEVTVRSAAESAEIKDKARANTPKAVAIITRALES